MHRNQSCRKPTIDDGPPMVISNVPSSDFIFTFVFDFDKYTLDVHARPRIQANAPHGGSEEQRRESITTALNKQYESTIIDIYGIYNTIHM